MELYIDGKLAVLKDSFSFQYESENPAFTDSEDYTLNIELPLKGCVQNLAIFGNMSRIDFGSRIKRFSAYLKDTHFSKRGMVAVTKVTQSTVTVQFLAGKAAQNLDSDFDELYINEMSLDNYMSGLSGLVPGKSNYNENMVAMPWWNESASAINNEIVVNKDGSQEWGKDVTDFFVNGVSFMPYLIYVAKCMCQKLKYKYDFSSWEKSNDRYLLVCNTIPYVWDLRGMQAALPNWTVSEFFNELEKFLVGTFQIDHIEKKITFNFDSDFEWENRMCYIENVVDEFSSEIEKEDSACDYKGIKKFSYENRGDDEWDYEDCQWLIDALKGEGKYYMEFETRDQFNEWRDGKFGGHDADSMATGSVENRPDWVSSVYYIKDERLYLMHKVKPKNTTKGAYVYQLVDFNRFGPHIPDISDPNEVSLKCVPVRINETDDEHGDMVFLSPGTFDWKKLDDDGIRQPYAYSVFKRGDADSPSFYNLLLLAYWKPGMVNSAGIQCPTVNTGFGLSQRYKDFHNGLKVAPREMVTFTWIGETIPDVQSVFIIRGKKYLCKKITATFTEKGLSQLLKGEFYPVVD